MSFTQSVWCSMDCKEGSLGLPTFHILIMLSLPALYSLFRLWSYWREFTPALWHLSPSSLITNETCTFLLPDMLKQMPYKLTISVYNSSPAQQQKHQTAVPSLTRAAGTTLAQVSCRSESSKYKL